MPFNVAQYQHDTKTCLQKSKPLSLSLFHTHTHTHTHTKWLAYQNSYWSDPSKKNKTGEKQKLKFTSTGDCLRVLWSSPWTYGKERIHKRTNQNSIHYPAETLISLSSDQEVSPQGCRKRHTGKQSMNTQLQPCHMYKYHCFPKKIHTWSSKLHNRGSCRTGWIYKQGCLKGHQQTMHMSRVAHFQRWHFAPPPLQPKGKLQRQYFIAVARKL